jgi:hypothetical protein
MTREEYYKQRSKERFERFCKWVDLHFYIETTEWGIFKVSNMLKQESNLWQVDYRNLRLYCNVKLDKPDDPIYSYLNIYFCFNKRRAFRRLSTTTFRRVLLEGCRRLKKIKNGRI